MVKLAGWWFETLTIVITQWWTRDLGAKDCVRRVTISWSMNANDAVCLYLY